MWRRDIENDRWAGSYTIRSERSVRDEDANVWQDADSVLPQN